MSDAAFREALDDFVRSIKGRVIWDEESADRAQQARDRVLALYAERQGEVYEVQVIRSEYDFVGIVLDDDGYNPGDKVRVTKVEEGQ